MIKAISIILVIFCNMFLISPVMADVVVIVNKANDSALSESDIKKIYLGKLKSFSNGKAITALTLGRGGATDTFNKKALSKSSSQLKSYWSKLVFTGKAKPLKAVDSENMLKLVSSNTDTIGYVDAASVNDSVKIVATYK